MTKSELDRYKEYVALRLGMLTPFLQNYAMGDFSEVIEIPEQADEFAELLTRVNLMVEEFQKMLDEREDTITRQLQIEVALRENEEQLLALFDGIDDVIYVSDPDTYELLYVNDVIKKSWGEDALGAICYERLQARQEPCPFCTNHLIFGEYQGKSYVWEFQNEITKDWYRCSDKAIRWSNGKLVRFELASNITEEKIMRQRLEESIAELEHTNSMMENFNRMAVGREQRMIELKRQINELSKRLGEEPPYDIRFADD